MDGFNMTLQLRLLFSCETPWIAEPSNVDIVIKMTPHIKLKGESLIFVIKC